MAIGERAVDALPEWALRAALEALAVVVVDASERAVYANRLGARLLGGGLDSAAGFRGHGPSPSHETPTPRRAASNRRARRARAGPSG